MTDGDDKLAKRYRELPAEEPPAALDAAIRAAAHRAVAPRSLAQRWAVPVSLAAVLVLAVGVTLRMQQEQPGIETALPVDSLALQAQKEPAPPPKLDGPASGAPPARPALPAPPVKAKDRAREFDSQREARQDAVKEEMKPAAPAPRPEDKNAAVAEPQAQKVEKLQQPKAFADSASQPPMPAAVAPPPIPPAKPAEPVAAGRLEAQASGAPRGQAAPAATMSAPAAPATTANAPMAFTRSKRDASVDLAKEVEKGPLERELDRIAQLRREGRHAEADEALAKFRRENPDYKIPEATWEQVKPR